MTVARYAPSPTGPLHLGNLRTALLSWLQARLSAGEIYLRMEDLDQPRVKPGSAQQIINDLNFLGLNFDNDEDVHGEVNLYYQSKRTTHYQQALGYLFAKKLIYPCYCSRKDIREAASAPHQALPIYPGTCRGKHGDVTPSNEKKVNGRLPAWRVKVDDQLFRFEDRLQGSFSQNLNEQVGDFVVRRSDGLFAYQLAVVVDDIEMGITDVLRGEDLLDSTCRQIALYQYLNAQAPYYWHVKLMHDDQGNRMAKRDGADSLTQLVNQGLSTQEIIGKLAHSCNLIDHYRPISAPSLLNELNLSSFIFRLQSTADKT